MNEFKALKEFLGLTPTKKLVTVFVVIIFVLCGVIKNLVGRLDGQRKECVQNEMALRNLIDIANNRNILDNRRHNRKKDSIYAFFQNKVEAINRENLRLYQMNRQ
jgi:hypothetical protein